MSLGNFKVLYHMKRMAWKRKKYSYLCISPTFITKKEDEGPCPTSTTGPSTRSTPYLQNHYTWWGRDIRHGGQGEHPEGHSGFTVNPATGQPDLCDWGWKVRKTGPHKHISNIVLICSFYCHMCHDQKFCPLISYYLTIKSSYICSYFIIYIWKYKSNLTLVYC